MAETEFKYDVFISYSHKDEKWADKVLRQRLDDADLRVCIDYRDFEAGKMALLNMQDAVKQSKHVVLALTRNWLKSEWSLFEALMAGTKDPAGLQKKLIPLLCEDGIQNDINDFIAARTWVDFTRKDREDIAWKQLFASLGKLEVFQSSTKTTDPVTRDTWNLAHPYPMLPNFTGRVAEQQMLDNWLADDKDHLLILRALGGFGKSALAWQWINTHVNPAEWTKLVWWSFYEGDASFEHFIEETLKYLNLEVPQGQRPQVDALLKAMQGEKILLIMDGFERALRAYSNMNAAYQGDEEPKLEENQLDCVNINGQIFLQKVCSLPNMTSKVLITTRLTPRAVKTHDELLQGCREVELTAMQKEDAVTFFRKQGIKGTHAEIETACAPYGYHPLSLRLLAGRILKDFENPADIIVAQKLKLDGDIKQQKHHVLEVSYNSLPPDEQTLLCTISCFRLSVEFDALKSIMGNKDSLDNDLHDLVERGLLYFYETNRKFDLHPIVRRYAYEQLSNSDRLTTHIKLKDYFALMLSKRTAKPVSSKNVMSTEELQTVIEVYHHTSQMESYDDAFRFYHDELEQKLYHLGAYYTTIELLLCLFSKGEEFKPLLKDKWAQARVLHVLAIAYSKTGNPIKATELFELELIICKSLDDIPKVAVIMRQLARIRLSLGSLFRAEQNLQYGIAELSNIDAEGLERGLHRQLGILFAYIGMHTKAKDELSYLPPNRSGIPVIAFSLDLATYSLFQKEWKEVLSKATSAQQKAYKFHRQGAIIQSEMLIGAALLGSRDFLKAEHHLSLALENCRRSNMIESESEILLYLARLCYDQENYQEAKSLAEEALLITERCGYVLQGADVNLFLAQYALEQDQNKAKAKEYAETALKLAYCDGPPYYYKVAYHEAERMLEKLAG